MQVQLVEAKKIEPQKIMQFRQGFIDYGEKSINGSRGLHHFNKYEEWIEKVLLCENENNDILGVASTLYLGVRISDQKIVGCIELRHSINDELKKLGGHIGYSVEPKERKKGYATEMLVKTIEKARLHNIDKILLTCDSENIASQKAILKCNGVLAKKEIIEYHGKETWTNYYWIKL